MLPQSGGLVHYRYPLNTEKFSARPLNDVAINVEVEEKAPLRALYSPGYPVSVTRDGEHKATVSYSATNVLPKQDFDLYYSVGADADLPGSVGVNLLSYQPFDDNGFLLLLVTPPIKSEQERVAQDVILVLDTSGSMQGEKLTQAKAAARYVLNNLGSEDRFNIISFDSSVHQFDAAPTELDQREKGLTFIDKMRAQGSTDINRALLEAVAGADRTRPTILIFLTDGQPTMGETNPDQIVANVTANAPKSVRLFAFGVGYDVDTVLLDQLSSGLRGTSAYVKPGESIDETVSGFFAKVSSPVLVDVSLKWDGVSVEDVYPYPLPDLFAGEQLIVAGRYRPSLDAAAAGNAARRAAGLTLMGTVNGKPQSFTYSDLAFATRGGDDFIARLWAQRKIGYLLAQIRLHGASDEAVKEVVDLSTRYGIVTPYTSFLVQEPTMALSSAGRDQIAQAIQATPAGGAPAAAAPALSGGARAGEGAVQRAEVEKQLQSDAYAAPSATQAAAAPAAPGTGPAQPAEAASEIRQVSDKTFILQAGTWVDTQYDTAKMTAEAIAFGSERYFQLVSQYPQIGPFLALGERVTLVLQGKAYAIGPQGNSQATTESPASGQPAVTPLAGDVATSTPGATAAPVATATVEPTALATLPTGNSGATAPAASDPGVGTIQAPAAAQAPLQLPCATGLVVGGLAVLPAWLRRRAGRGRAGDRPE